MNKFVVFFLSLSFLIGPVSLATSGDPVVTSVGSTALGAVSTLSPLLGAASTAELVFYCVKVRKAIDILDTIGCTFDKAGEIVHAPDGIRVSAWVEATTNLFKGKKDAAKAVQQDALNVAADGQAQFTVTRDLIAYQQELTGEDTDLAARSVAVALETYINKFN